MNRFAQSPFDPETFLRHARKVASISRETEDTIRGLVAESINRYLENWDETLERESRRLRTIIKGLNTALAAIIAKTWTFPDDDSAPFHDEASAYAWLSAEGEEPSYIGGQEDFAVRGREEFFQFERDWAVRNLWDVRKEFETQYWDLHAWHDFRVKDHWNRPPESAARLPTDLQELIHNLCQIWHDHVDPQLGLPRKDPNPDNPLLRFVGACLAIALGDNRPANKTVLGFISKRSRQAIRKQDAENEQQKRYVDDGSRDPDDGPDQTA